MKIPANGLLSTAAPLLMNTLIFATLAPSAHADDTAPPPYVMTQAKGVVVGVTWEESAVRKALPPGIRPVPDMSGGIVIYDVAQGSGLAPYSSAYFYVEVEGFDSRDGTKAHWMLQGVYGPDPKVAIAMSKYYGLPVRTGTSSVEANGGMKRYIGTLNGRTFVTAEIQPDDKSCEPATAFEHYPGYDARTKQVVVLEIPEVGIGCGAQTKALKIDAPAGDPFAQFKVKSITDASEFKDWSYSFTHPQPAPKR